MNLPDHEGEALPAPQLHTLLGPCPDGMAGMLAKEFAPAGIHRLELYLSCPNHPAWRLPRER